jgi:hypothetical protein
MHGTLIADGDGSRTVAIPCPARLRGKGSVHQWLRTVLEPDSGPNVKILRGCRGGRLQTYRTLRRGGSKTEEVSMSDAAAVDVGDGVRLLAGPHIGRKGVVTGLNGRDVTVAVLLRDGVERTVEEVVPMDAVRPLPRPRRARH